MPPQGPCASTRRSTASVRPIVATSTRRIAGANGPIVVPFFELVAAPNTDPRFDELERGRIKDCVTADPALLADIVAHPDLYYVNLHNTRYPGGAFRCQLDR